MQMWSIKEEGCDVSNYPSTRKAGL